MSSFLDFVNNIKNDLEEKELVKEPISALLNEGIKFGVGSKVLTNKKVLNKYDNKKSIKSGSIGEVVELLSDDKYLVSFPNNNYAEILGDELKPAPKVEQIKQVQKPERYTQPDYDADRKQQQHNFFKYRGHMGHYYINKYRGSL
jgi:hypothetical protein